MTLSVCWRKKIDFVSCADFDVTGFTGKQVKGVNRENMLK